MKNNIIFLEMTLEENIKETKHLEKTLNLFSSSGIESPELIKLQADLQIMKNQNEDLAETIKGLKNES